MTEFKKYKHKESGEEVKIKKINEQSYALYRKGRLCLPYLSREQFEQYEPIN